MSIKDFSNYFNVEYGKVVDKIHKMGLNSKKARHVIWTQDEDALLRLHFEYAPKDYLLNLFPNRSWAGIVQRGLKTLKLNRLSQDKTYINYLFFDTWNESSSYVHGFILADGHIHLGNDNYLQIEVNGESLDVLERICHSMDYHGKIYHLKSRDTYKFQDKNVHLIEQLANSGIALNDKSHSAKYPIGIIPKKYLRDHIRGIIDGDGWSYIDGNGIYNLGLCGTEDVVSNVKNLLIEDCSMNSVQHYEKNCWRFNIKGKKALRIAAWLYDEAEIYLEKKYNAYKYAYNDYILRHSGN